MDVIYSEPVKRFREKWRQDHHGRHIIHYCPKDQEQDIYKEQEHPSAAYMSSYKIRDLVGEAVRGEQPNQRHGATDNEEKATGKNGPLPTYFRHVNKAHLSINQQLNKNCIHETNSRGFGGGKHSAVYSAEDYYR